MEILKKIGLTNKNQMSDKKEIKIKAWMTMPQDIDFWRIGSLVFDRKSEAEGNLTSGEKLAEIL